MDIYKVIEVTMHLDTHSPDINCKTSIFTDVNKAKQYIENLVSHLSSPPTTTYLSVDPLAKDIWSLTWSITKEVGFQYNAYSITLSKDCLDLNKDIICFFDLNLPSL
jgi:hypothetical protein